DAEDVDQVEVGMTRSQVRFLLGTPMVADTFDKDRWDYFYSLRRGHSREITKRHLVVWFEGDKVTRIGEPIPLARPRSADAGLPRPSSCGPAARGAGAARAGLPRAAAGSPRGRRR